MEWTTAGHWMGRTVLVTGASGFIGHSVCTLLLQAGATVHATWYSRLPPEGVISHHASFPEDAERVVRQARPEVVFHLAAPVRLARDPSLYTLLKRGILDTTVTIAQICQEQGIRLVQVGTCEEYGNSQAPFRETAPARPVSPYSALKAAATHWVLMLTRTSDLQATVVRPFRAFGPHDRSSVVAQACRAALSRTPFPMTDGRQIREWNEVDAIASGIIAAGAHPDAMGRILNLGGGTRCAVRDLVAQIFSLAGAPPELVQAGALPRRGGEVEHFWGCHEAAKSLWGPLPQPSLADALLDTLAWARDFDFTETVHLPSTRESP